VAWLDRQPSESIWTTAITVFEVRFGLGQLVPGRRRRRLETAFTRSLVEDFQGRVLPFDEDAAEEAAGRAAERRAAGRPGDFRDIEIAGIVAVRRATLATRNARHFEGLGIKLVNPWASR
jgi:predicted nucleic acid-binding protein